MKEQREEDKTYSAWSYVSKHDLLHGRLSKGLKTRMWEEYQLLLENCPEVVDRNLPPGSRERSGYERYLGEKGATLKLVGGSEDISSRYIKNVTIDMVEECAGEKEEVEYYLGSPTEKQVKDFIKSFPKGGIVERGKWEYRTPEPDEKRQKDVEWWKRKFGGVGEEEER